VKVVTVVGARPQFIKAAPVSDALARRGVQEVMVHTGQHYDRSMSEVFFEELAIRPPAYNLGVGSGSHGAQTARMLGAIEEVLAAEAPQRAVVYGDTNSTLAGALAAAKMHIPVAHVEAGLRSFDRSMPEEINRVAVDHVAALCLAPTEIAMRNLAREGLDKVSHHVGDVTADAIARTRASERPLRADVAGIGKRSNGYLVATVHRAATTDDPRRLSAAMSLLGRMPIPVVLPLHPRTRAALDRHRLIPPPTVHVIEPLGYGDMLAVMAGAAAVLTDSGGLQKEAYILGVRCITLRDTTEWIETVDAGWNSLVDLDAERALAGYGAPLPARRPNLFGDGHAAERCARLITGDPSVVASAAVGAPILTPEPASEPSPSGTRGDI
jgi:UDP-N-acetylglucosamine 2-epimerase